MRSPASGVRGAAEWSLRVLVVVLLAWRLALALGAEPPAAVEVARSADLRAALARWSSVIAPTRVHAALDYPPTEVERDWLAALPGAGTTAVWSGPNLLPTAIGVLPVADPAGGADLLLAAPAGASAVVGDSTARADTSRVSGAVTRFHLPRPGPRVQAAVGPVRAQAALLDSLGRRKLLVIGRAGWETKFIVAALEERGWIVDAHIVVAPGGDVAQGALLATGPGARASATPAPAQPAPGGPVTIVQGGGGGVTRMMRTGPPAPAAPRAAAAARPLQVGAIDTATYSAVVAVDSTAAREARRIVRFVRSGGGLVLTAGAAEMPGLARLAPGRPGAVLGEEGARLTGPVSRDALPIRPLLDLKPDAVVLERRGGRIVTAARREGIGRVVETGALELWRWRMAGADGAVDEYRSWLARLVAGVAHTSRHPIDAPALDPAPLATLIDYLGPAVLSAPPATRPAPDPLPWWIFAVLCGALLLEWLSRRLRSRA